MPPLLFRGMKGVTISCASPASTATCTSMDPRRSVAGRHSSTATARGIDRLQGSPHLRDARRARSLKNWVVPPSPSKLMKSYAQKSRKSADVTAAPAGSLVSPAASSRYLLNDDDDADAFFDVFPDLDPLPVLIPINSSRFQFAAGDDSPALRPSCSSSSSFAAAASAAAASRDLQVRFRASSSSSPAAPPTPSQAAKCDGSVPVVLGPSDSSTKYGEHLRFRASSSSSSPTLPTRSQSAKCDGSVPVVLGPSDSTKYGVQLRFRASSSSSPTPPTPSQAAKCDGSVPVVLGPSDSTKYGEHLRAAAAAALPPASGFRIVKGDASPVINPSSPSRRSQNQAFFRSSSALSETRFHTTRVAESAVLKPSPSARTRDQVVVLRVSLHCKGCEAKVKKHISRMEGVTSFSIDFAAKKVTVIGDVTPLGVLSSISKVKNAQFWPSPVPRSSTSS